MRCGIVRGAVDVGSVFDVLYCKQVRNFAVFFAVNLQKVEDQTLTKICPILERACVHADVCFKMLKVRVYVLAMATGTTTDAAWPAGDGAAGRYPLPRTAACVRHHPSNNAWLNRAHTCQCFIVRTDSLCRHGWTRRAATSFRA
jgi:hypothetical protein